MPGTKSTNISGGQILLYRPLILSFGTDFDRIEADGGIPASVVEGGHAVVDQRGGLNMCNVARFAGHLQDRLFEL